MLETLIEKLSAADFRTLIRDWKLQDLGEVLKHCAERAGQGTKHGYIFQDTINVLGERLGFKVQYGPHGPGGADGIWETNGTKLVVESKVSSFWKGSLEETDRFVKTQGGNCGMLVSSEFDKETISAAKGGYPNIRLVSADRLLKLAELKEEGIVQTEHILPLLVPQENYTLDPVIDLLYNIKSQFVAGAEEEKRPPKADLWSQQELAQFVKETCNADQQSMIRKVVEAGGQIEREQLRSQLGFETMKLAGVLTGVTIKTNSQSKELFLDRKWDADYNSYYYITKPEYTAWLKAAFSL